MKFLYLKLDRESIFIFHYKVLSIKTHFEYWVSGTLPMAPETSRLNNDLPTIVIHSIIIPYSRTVINLELTKNTKLTWEDHASKLAAGTFNLSLDKFSNLLPSHTGINLVNSLIIPVFTYADAIFLSDLNSSSSTYFLVVILIHFFFKFRSLISLWKLIFIINRNWNYNLKVFSPYG